MSVINRLKSIFIRPKEAEEPKEVSPPPVEKITRKTREPVVQKSVSQEAPPAKDVPKKKPYYSRNSSYRKPAKKIPPRSEQEISPPAPVEEKKVEAVRKTFSELGLDASLVEIMKKNRLVSATEVQEESIPVALGGRNLFCSAETGSGKTLSFLLPMIHKLNKKEIDQALIICPTREIAIQTQKVLQMFNSQNHKSALVIGGTDIEEQKKALREYPSILVATPGRLLDMLGTGLIWLQYTGYVVLDEADRMLDMGFEEDLIKIHAELKGKHQTLLYSATLFPQVMKMAQRYASDYHKVIIGSPHDIPESVEHIVVEMSESEKFDALIHLLYKSTGQIIVFFNTIRDTDAINRRLKRMNFRKVNCIHSKRDQATREQLITDFRAKRIKVLLASDVAARGIDIPNVEMVINYDIPNNSEEYIHRVGRTGRAGKTGKAVSFYAPRDRSKLYAIEKLIKSTIDRKTNFKHL